MNKIMTYNEFEQTMTELSNLCLNASSDKEMEKFSEQISELRDTYPEFDVQYADKFFSENDKE